MQCFRNLSLLDTSMLSDAALFRLILRRVSKLLRPCLNRSPWLSQDSIALASNLHMYFLLWWYHLDGFVVVQVQFVSASKNCNRDARWAGNAGRRIHATIRSGPSFSSSISYVPGIHVCIRCFPSPAYAGFPCCLCRMCEHNCLNGTCGTVDSCGFDCSWSPMAFAGFSCACSMVPLMYHHAQSDQHHLRDMCSPAVCSADGTTSRNVAIRASFWTWPIWCEVLGSFLAGSSSL